MTSLQEPLHFYSIIKPVYKKTNLASSSALTVDRAAEKQRMVYI